MKLINLLLQLVPCGEDADEDEYCTILKRVLELDETDWGGPSSDNSSGTPAVTYPLAKASWRKSIFELIVRVYQEACPQVSRNLPPALVRIIEYFFERIANDKQTVAPPDPVPEVLTAGQLKYNILNKEVLTETAKQGTEMWYTIAKKLKACAVSATKIEFYRTKDKAMEETRKKMEVKLSRITQEPESVRAPEFNLAEVMNLSA